MSQAVWYHCMFNVRYHKQCDTIACSTYDVTSHVISLHSQYTISQTRYCGYEVMISGIENRWIYVTVSTAVTLQWGTIPNTNCGSFTLDSNFSLIKFYPVHICALASLYQTNTNKCTHTLSNHQFINTFAASYLNTQGLNNWCLKSPASTLVDLTFQSRALRSFSLNQLRNLSL